MAQPTLAPRTPVACAGCYGQYPDRLHVDFRAAIEGRLVDPSQPRGPHVDWVILCEKCLRDGVALLPEVKDQREALEQRVTDLETQLAAAQDYADRIEDAFQRRPTNHERLNGAEAKPRAPKPRKPRYESKASA
jgi:hypothetical protein